MSGLMDRIRALESRIRARVVPYARAVASPPDGFGYLFIDQQTGKLALRKPDGTTTKYAAGGGSGTLDHAALTSNLAWGTSGHTGAAGEVAGFDGSGDATTYAIGTAAGTVAAGDDPRLVTHGLGGAYAVFGTTSGGWTGAGMGAPLTQGTLSQAFADGLRWASYASTATVSSRAGIYANTAATSILSTGMDFTLYFAFRTPSSLTNLRVFIGATVGQNSNSSTPSNQGMVAHFSAPDGDTRLSAFARDAGGASSGTAFGPVLAVNTSYMFRLRFDATAQIAYFGCYAGIDRFGDYGTEHAIATNIPASTTNLGYECCATAQAGGTAVTWLVWRPWIEFVCVPA